MKTLDKYILKSYFGPFIVTFVISMFVLMMQFLWKYLEDLVGKGLDWTVLAEFFVYASASLIPLALPLSILLSSIMVFGNLGESYELAAFKAAGVSLQRVMTPLIVLAVLISIMAFLFSNYVLPVANLKMGSLLYDITDKKPAFNIKEGVYYYGIEGYAIRIGKKEKDGKTIHNIFIYDHTEHRGNVKVVFARTGKMEMSSDENYLLLTLHNGGVYEDLKPSTPSRQNRPFMRSTFKEEHIKFDLSDFKLNRTKEDLFKDNYQMMDVVQLSNSIDTVRQEILLRRVEFGKQMQRNMGFFPEKKPQYEFYFNPKWEGNVLSDFSKPDKIRTVEAAINILRGSKNYTEAIINDLNARKHTIVRFEMEWHRKFTLSIACLVLFFIGAPLGAIVRKGGLGMPVVLSVLFFLAFHIVFITGEKFAKEEVWTPFSGMWFSTFIFLPIGIFLTVKSTSDSKLFDLNFYLSPIRKLIARKKKV